MMNLLGFSSCVALSPASMQSCGGRDSGPKHPDFSLRSYHYAPQNHAILAPLPYLLATIPLSPTDS